MVLWSKDFITLEQRYFSDEYFEMSLSSHLWKSFLKYIKSWNYSTVWKFMKFFGIFLTCKLYENKMISAYYKQLLVTLIITNFTDQKKWESLIIFYCDNLQEQSFVSVLWKQCSENICKIHPCKSLFFEINCRPTANFQKPLLQTTSGWLLLNFKWFTVFKFICPMK